MLNMYNLFLSNLLRTYLKDRYHYPHFIVEDNEAQRDCEIYTKVTSLGSGSPGIQTQVSLSRKMSDRECPVLGVHVGLGTVPRPLSQKENKHSKRFANSVDRPSEAGRGAVKQEGRSIFGGWGWGAPSAFQPSLHARREPDLNWTLSRPKSRRLGGPACAFLGFRWLWKPGAASACGDRETAREGARW